MADLPQQATCESPAGQTRILVIDDDDCVGTAIKATLGRHRYEIVLAPRASDGIQALAQSRYDIVLVDIFLPGLSGLDTIEQIRHGSAMPIIAMSGFRLRGAGEALDYLGMAARRGATLCLRKPFKAAQLIDAVEWSRCLLGKTEGSKN